MNPDSNRKFDNAVLDKEQIVLSTEPNIINGIRYYDPFWAGQVDVYGTQTPFSVHVDGKDGDTYTFTVRLGNEQLSGIRFKDHMQPGNVVDSAFNWAEQLLSYLKCNWGGPMRPYDVEDCTVITTERLPVRELLWFGYRNYVVSGPMTGSFTPPCAVSFELLAYAYRAGTKGRALFPHVSFLQQIKVETSQQRNGEGKELIKATITEHPEDLWLYEGVPGYREMLPCATRELFDAAHEGQTQFLAKCGFAWFGEDEYTRYYVYIGNKVGKALLSYSKEHWDGVEDWYYDDYAYRHRRKPERNSLSQYLRIIERISPIQVYERNSYAFDLHNVSETQKTIILSGLKEAKVHYSISEPYHYFERNFLSEAMLRGRVYEKIGMRERNEWCVQLTDAVALKRPIGLSKSMIKACLILLNRIPDRPDPRYYSININSNSVKLEDVFLYI